MGRADFFRKGDFNRRCDRCGVKVKASDTQEEWTGVIVCSDGCFEERHPQDFVRGKYDEQRVYKPRPDGGDRFASDFPVTEDDL